MHTLKFLPGPKLLYRWFPMPDWAEVSERAHQFLFEAVELDPGLTLADIFGLLRACAPLRDVLHLHYAQALFDEVEKGPLPPATDSPVEALEYLEVYAEWHLNTATKTYESLHKLSARGVGYLLEEDAPDYGRKAGERVLWSVSTYPLRELLHLPVRVRPTVSVFEADLDARAFGDELYQVVLEHVSLGQILQGIFSELSFHGTPADVEDLIAELQEEMNEPDDDTTLISADELLEPRDRPACNTLFDNLGAHSVSEIRRAVKDVEDDQNIVQALDVTFGNEVVVKMPYRELTGRSFRAAFRNAQGSFLDEDLPGTES